MRTQHLGIDDEDFCMDIIPRIETSFGFRFDEHDLLHVRTYGEFCEAILAKLATADVADCTTQQAFYKLRKAFRHHMPTVCIEPATLLTDILPAGGHQRRRLVALIEAEMGFKLHLIGPSGAIVVSGCLLLVFSAILLFFNVFLGGAGLVLGLAILHIADKMGSRIQVKTIRDVVRHISSWNYRQSRRNHATVNRREIIYQLKYIFTHDLGLEPAELTPDALLF